MKTTRLAYLSWGGIGNVDTLRAAAHQASDEGFELLYLAVLDDDSFGDVDDFVLTVVADELEWLLTVQLDLIKSELGVDDMASKVVVTSGELKQQAGDLAQKYDLDQVVIGASGPYVEAAELAATSIREAAAIKVKVLTH